MKNHKQIRRIYEQNVDLDTTELGMQPGEMEMPAMPMAPALPAPGETTVVADPMTMTVADFITKCKSIDPLVCMGIEAFIEKNKAAFGEPAVPVAMTSELPMEPAPTFSQAIETPVQPAQPAATSFSLDQPADALNFPA